VRKAGAIIRGGRINRLIEELPELTEDMLVRATLKYRTLEGAVGGATLTLPVLNLQVGQAAIQLGVDRTTLSLTTRSLFI
jgi:hypothetical protein